MLCVDAQLMLPVRRTTSDVNLAAASQDDSPVTVKTTVAIGRTNATAVSIRVISNTRSYSTDSCLILTLYFFLSHPGHLLAGDGSTHLVMVLIIINY